MAVKILRAGPMMTVQDSGRFGYSDKGITQSGVLDHYSYDLVNCVLGNHRNEAVIEMIIFGGDFEFTENTFFALGGADMDAKLSGRNCSLYKVYKASAGDILSMSCAKSGCHGYIAFGGGIDVPSVMESRSTNVKCGFGGYCGRKLMAGDIISTGNAECEENKLDLPIVDVKNVIRVVAGAQIEKFTQHGKEVFFGSEYTVSGNYDRMGCRLIGEKIESVDGMDIISDGIAFGSIQISSDGQPIVMLADRQTTGGYAKIGAVAAVDIPEFVQHKPGDKIRFEEISVKQAQKEYIRREKYILKLFKKYERV